MKNSSLHSSPEMTGKIIFSLWLVEHQFLQFGMLEHFTTGLWFVNIIWRKLSACL